MALEIENYATILIELNKAVKMHNLYPQGHPNLDATLGRSYVLLKKIIDEAGEVKWKIDQKGFYDGKVPIAPGNHQLADLAKKLFFRRVKEITLTSNITQADLKGFLAILKIEPDELREMGGIEAFIAVKGIEGILLNEMSYEALKKLKKELEEKQKEEEKVEVALGKEEASAGESAESAEKKPPPPPPQKETEKEESFSLLVERIRGEADAIKYTDLAVRIKEKADNLLIEKKFDEVFPALAVFLEHASPLSGLSNDIRATALDKLASFLTAEVLRYLIGKTGEKGADYGAAQHMLLRGGDQSIELILSALIEAPDAVIRRNLFNTALMFGKRIIPLVEKYFASDQWYVVRQMVSLLGELGDPASIDAIISAYGNPDVRIKKEALKSLARIQSPRSKDFLLKAIEEEDPSLVAQAVISLGMLRDSSAVEPIGRIALKWEPFADNQDPKKEAIKALGIIGDARAVPFLAKVLSKKAWFGKRINEEVRLLAANALGMIQNPEADKTLQAAMDGSAGELYNVCKRILEGREKKAI